MRVLPENTVIYWTRMMVHITGFSLWWKLIRGSFQMQFALLGQNGGDLELQLTGDWTRGAGQVTKDGKRRNFGVELLAEFEKIIRAGSISTVRFNTAELTHWDSKLIVLILAIQKYNSQKITIDDSGLPQGLRSLIALSRAAPARGGRGDAKPAPGFLEDVGQHTLDVFSNINRSISFLGISLRSFGRMFTGKARYQKSDVRGFILASGPQALPIVSIVNILLGVILAFMGAVQLKQFGAEIYVANLVSLGQTREIAPMMTAIVMAGRTGAAYAAQLGTMQVNEEVDALKTFGFSPIDFLVLPRMLALAIMMPFLVLYADVLGIFGGYLIGISVLDIGTIEYIEQTRAAIDITDIALGVFKGSVFGVLVAVTGCMHGMYSGRSASAVGDAATKAVVSGIIAIIGMTAVFSILAAVLGI
jgi:phospholipid/cholesterol/gamma-HCH transport system permease protein